MIFYGLLGIGKMFLVCAMVKYFIVFEATKFVQFYFVYSYEDFFEGF